ncbi:MAG: hypothetical protein ACP5C4_08275 [Methanomicrobiales archaeon]
MRVVDERALSEVIGFILILALLTVFLSMYNLYVVPAQGREDEIDHMNDIRERFINYKISLDNLWMNNMSGNQMTGITLSTAFELSNTGSATAGGGFLMPVMSPVPSTGAFMVGTRTDTISFIADDGTNPSEVYNETMGDVQLEVDNNYFIPQSYYYQMGGIFLEQQDGTSVRVSPSLSIYRLINLDPEVGNTTVVNCVPIQMYRGPSAYTSGQGVVRVDTRLRYPIVQEDFPGNESVTITVQAEDEKSADAWRNIFQDAVWRAGFTASDEGTYYDITNDTRTDISLTLNAYTDEEPAIHQVDLHLIEPSYIATLQTVTTAA